MTDLPLPAPPLRGEATRAHDGVFRAGDPVVLLDHRQRGTLEVLAPGGRADLRGRRIEHDAVIGLPVGEAAEASTGERYLALRPTLAEYALLMPRAATPIYPKDLGALLVGADVFPGASVLEAGTGSGALTLALLRAVGASGRVVSYEARSISLSRARENVRAWCGGDPPNLTTRVRDIYSGLVDDGPFDRVLLDLTEPWRVIPHVVAALRAGGLVAGFTPSVPQMQQLVAALAGAGFGAIECLETSQRRWRVTGERVRPEHRMTAHTGFLVFARRATGRPDPRAEAGANPDG